MSSKLALAKAKVLSAREVIEQRHAVPVAEAHQLVGDLVDIIHRNVPEERREFVAREPARW